MAALRRGQGRKVVIIIDQFEQWLHAHRAEPDAELVKALRQCDGGRLQAIVMLRDDFSMAASRFMRSLDTRIVEGDNFATVDLFGVSHATKVLTKFGQSFEKLPANTDDMSADERQFVNDVVQGLAQDGKVVSVRLSLFADMIRKKPWTAATLKQVGGTEGIGMNFLEETFSSLQANPDHRLHAAAARHVLRALLPDLGTDIRGHMRSHAELLAASGYQDQLASFAELLRILDGGLRLITPTDPEGKDEGGSMKDETRESPNPSFIPYPSSLGYYQLTHDYLVTSLRDWLTRKQRETRSGRAELKLEERSAIWNAKRENKQLPTVTEWISIRILTDSKHWTASKRALMSKAAQVHGTLWGGLLLTVLLLGIGIQQWASAERWKNLREQTRAAAESLQNNLGPTVPVNLKELGKLPTELVVPELRTRFASATNARHKLSLAFALAGYGELDADYLTSRIDDIAEMDTRNYVTALQTNPKAALAALKAETLKCSDKSLWRRKAKLAIAALGLGDAELALDVCAFENRSDPEQRTLFIDEFPGWDTELNPVLDAVKNSDSPALRSGICLAVGRVSVEKIIEADKESWKLVASQWFVEHGDTSTHSAAGWLLRHWNCPVPAIPKLHEITPQRDWYVVKTSGATMLRIRPSPADVSGIPNPTEKYTQQLRELEQVVAAELEKPEILETRAVAYFHTGKLAEALGDLNRLTKDGATERQPTILQHLTLTLAKLGRADEARASLARYLESNISASYKSYMQIQVAAWLGDIPEASRQLESAIKDGPSDQDTLYNVACAAALCAQATAERDPDPSRQCRIRALDLLQKLSDVGYRKWDYLSQEPDFAVLHGDPRFASIISAMKNPAEFWVADREVTRGQVEEFINDASYAATEKPADWRGVEHDYSPTADHTAQLVNWYDALLYCNWLSIREGLSACYERTGKTEKDGHREYEVWRLIPGATGYRLLHEAEWESACRAGTTTEFSSGDDEGLLVAYCQTYPSKLTATCGEKLPNAWGLHDMHGNVWEWCWEKYREGGALRVLRGGSFDYSSLYARSALRINLPPDTRMDNVGFRVGRTLQPVPLTALPPAEGGSKFEVPKTAAQVQMQPVVLKSRPLMESGLSLTSVQHSSVGSLVLLGGFDHLARLVDVKTQNEIRVFRGHENVVWCVALSPDGRTAVTGGEDKTLRLWDVATGEELDRSNADGIFSCVRYSADGESVFASNWDTKVRIWKLSGDRLGTRKDVNIGLSTLDIALLPDERQFLIGTLPGQVLLCDAESGMIQQTFEGHSGSVHSVAVLNAGKQFLSASHDSTLRLWDVATAKTERVYLGHLGVVNEVRALPDGKRFLSCGADRTLRLWDIASRREVARGIGSAELRGLSVAPDGESCLTAGLDGTLWEWELPETTEFISNSSNDHTPQMLSHKAFDADFVEKSKLLLRPMHVFAEIDAETNQPLYAIDWGPADGVGYMVHHGIPDFDLKQNDAKYLLKGYKRAEVKTVTIDGVNHHIGFWTK